MCVPGDKLVGDRVNSEVVAFERVIEVFEEFVSSGYSEFESVCPTVFVLSEFIFIFSQSFSTTLKICIKV